jgi:hypothetical protein
LPTTLSLLTLSIHRSPAWWRRSRRDQPPSPEPCPLALPRPLPSPPGASHAAILPFPFSAQLSLPESICHAAVAVSTACPPLPDTRDPARITPAMPPAMKRKRPIAARTRRATAALSTVQPVASEATPALSLRFTRERRPKPVPMCVSCGGGREGPPRSALRRSPELASPLRAKARSPDVGDDSNNFSLHVRCTCSSQGTSI